jgi:hypothetical protein
MYHEYIDRLEEIIVMNVIQSTFASARIPKFEFVRVCKETGRIAGKYHTECTGKGTELAGKFQNCAACSSGISLSQKDAIFERKPIKSHSFSQPNAAMRGRPAAERRHQGGRSRQRL